jgi:hypothetical protein
MSDEFAKGYMQGNYVTKNFPYNLPIIRDMERFSINNFHQTIPFTGNPKLTAGYDKGVEDMTLALKNKPAQGEKMNINELMQKLASQPVANTGMEESVMKQQNAQMVEAQNMLGMLKQIGQTRILTDDEKNQARQAQGYLQSINSPMEVMPPDVDNLNLSPEALKQLLEVIENPNFRGFPMQGGR